MEKIECHKQNRQSSGKTTGKNKHLTNVALEQGEPFGQDFEHGVLEWKANEIRPTSDDEHTFGDEEMISSSDQNLETAKKKNSKAGSKKKFTPKYLTKTNPGYLQDGFIFTKISMTNKSVKPALWRETFRAGMGTI